MPVPAPNYRVALAALLYALPALASELATLPAGAAQLLALPLLNEPAEQALVRQAVRDAAGDVAVPLVQGPLRSSFTRLGLNGDEPPAAWHALAPLPTWRAPTQVPPKAERMAYLAGMFAALDALAEAVDTSDLAQLYDQLLTWIEQFGHCLPAHRDDVSLAAQARLTSALAACLAQSASDATDNAASYCLVGASLLGGRGYCLGAATDLGRLRARGAYLAALAEALGRELAERLGVPHGNIVFRDDERWYLLAANTPATHTAVEQLGNELSSWFHSTFAGELTLALAHVPVPSVQLQSGHYGQPGFGAAVAALAQALDTAGYQTGQRALVAATGWNEDAFVFRQHSFALHPPCTGCGRFPGTQPNGLCSHCSRDERLHQLLAPAQALAFHRKPVAGSFELLPGWALLPVTHVTSQPLGTSYILLQHETTEHNRAVNGMAQPYFAGHLPHSEAGAPLSITELGAQSGGRAHLGYLQVALDQSNTMLLQRLSRTADGYDSAAQVMTLGYELERLRQAGLQQLLEQPRYQHFAALHMGGATLLIGPWDQATPLALDWHALLGQATGKNTGITCSAGLFFARPYYSLGRAAAATDELLAQAQLRPWHDATGQRRVGDQLSLLGDTFHWADAPQLFNEVALLEQHGQFISSALLRNLVEYGRLQRLWRDEGRTEGLRYKALFVYSLARALRRGDAELYRWADEIIRSLHGTAESMSLQHIGVIASYLLLTRREE